MNPMLTIPEADRALFNQLAATDIWILGIALRGAPFIPDFTDPAAAAALAQYRVDMAEASEDDSVLPFNFERESKQWLPFFSSEERAKTFFLGFGEGFDFSLFQPCKFLAGFVATPEFEIFELILDPGSDGERAIQDEERLFLREISQPRS